MADPGDIPQKAEAPRTWPRRVPSLKQVGLRLNSEHCPAGVPGGAEELTILDRLQEVVPEAPAEVGGWGGQGLGTPKFSLTGVCAQLGRGRAVVAEG